MSGIAVLLCEGCELGSALDMGALTRLASGQQGVGTVKSVPCLCSEAGADVLRECASDEPSAMVLGACAARFMPLTTKDCRCRIERVALRELAVWSHEARHDETQALAGDYLRMGLIRALKSAAPEPDVREVERTVLVVGGGAAGIAAALAAAGAGYRVVVVEQGAELGGWLRETKRLPPSRAPYRDLEPSPLDSLVNELVSLPLVTVHAGATVARITGEPGRFEVELRTPGGTTALRAGGIVQATGFTPYDANRLPHLGYGDSPDVVTTFELERMLAAGPVCRPSNGQPARRIAFVQCAGSRDPAHLPYCSTVCCRTTLKQALWAREIDPDCEAYVVAKDLRSPGVHEAFYRRAQEDPLVFFTKGEVRRVKVGKSGSLSVEITGGLLGDDVELPADLVVLAVGMVPRASNNDALRELSDARAALAKGGPGQAAAEETIRRLEVLADTGTLGLGYRQGPDLPLDRYGFPDSHFICFPYETRRTGIYTAGAVRAPNDLEACCIDGQGAALKAIQAIEHAAEGLAMHPRWGDVAPPTFNLQRCTQCKRCTEECPFGTLDEDERCTPKLNSTRCRRCGICLGACPERIISFPDYSIDIVSTLVKSVPIPDEFEESPRILVFACENDAYPALEMAGLHRHTYSAYVRVIPVRCLGSVNVIWIADAMAMGYDGVLLLGCKPGDDTQCHFMRGSDLMATRSENVKQKLTQLALEDERVRIEYVAITDFSTLGGRIDAFVERIQEIGLNPFKDV
ncbi:MAG: hydrogenase iron-sulfur subunit [Polyangiaceae bacterium]|nr:hydrogenase iron-sulfur subunit [Polyangiaceae bacterium]